MVTINQLAEMVAEIAGITIEKRHVTGPIGVRGRNSDNTLMRKVTGWQPEISLEEGLVRTYGWIEEQMRKMLPKLGKAGLIGVGSWPLLNENFRYLALISASVICAIFSSALI